MAYILYRRILHPVGQGAFFSAHFCYDNQSGTNKPFLNVVYDCGTVSRGKDVPTKIQKEVDITFNADDHIDLLFISHFDEDHTNGLDYLLDQTRIDHNTYAVIPFAYPYLIMVMEDNYPSMARFIKRAIEKKVKFVGIGGRDLERPLEIVASEAKETGLITLDSNNLFTVWNTDSKRPLWYFYPFMTIDIDSLQAKFEAMVGQDKKLSGIDVNNAKEVIAHKKELKDIYKKIGKTKNRVSKINVNSLLMMSFPAKDLKVVYANFLGYGFEQAAIEYGYRDYDRMLRHLRYHCSIAGPTCLYTGDSVIEEKGDFDMISRHAIGVMRSLTGYDKIDLMQIPHHGSEWSFPSGMMVNLKPTVRATFVNCNPYRKYFRDSCWLIVEAARHEIPLHIISNFFQSRIEIFAFIQ